MSESIQPGSSRPAAPTCSRNLPSLTSVASCRVRRRRFHQPRIRPVVSKRVRLMIRADLTKGSGAAPTTCEDDAATGSRNSARTNLTHRRCGRWTGEYEAAIGGGPDPACSQAVSPRPQARNCPNWPIPNNRSRGSATSELQATARHGLAGHATSAVAEWDPSRRGRRRTRPR
jgi:hypothetical protein